jgi:putative inorganic carbon (hco3(-)) transporter
MAMRPSQRASTVTPPPTLPARGGRERLAFNLGTGSTVPSRSVVEAAIASESQPTFATAAYAEPRDWGYRGLLAFTAVLMLRPQDHVPGLSALHIAEICAFLGIAPMLLHRFAHRLPVFRITPETVGLMLFGGVIVATAPFSIWPGGALTVFTDSYLKIVIVFILMMNTLTTPKRLEQLTWLILVACGYISLRAVLDYVRGVHIVENGRVFGSISGIFGNPNDLALNMVTFLPAALVIAMGRHAPPLRRAAAALIAALMLAAIVFTKSRGGALGLFVMVAALVLLGRKVRPGFGAMAIGAVLVAMPLLPSSFWTRMETIVNEDLDREQFTGSREARRVVMQEGFDAFLEHPLTGVGAGQFKNYNPPNRKERWRETHNALLQVASELGIFGVMAFLFLIVRGALGAAGARRMLARTRSDRGSDPLRLVMSEADRRSLYTHTVAMTAGMIGWFVCALFASVAYNWTFYYLLALIAAGRELARDRLAAGRAIEAQMKGVSLPSAMFSRRVGRGAA